MIEAHFDLTRYQMEPFFSENDIEYDADDCIIRRELTSAGKSRAFINDTPVPLTMLKELGDRLVDVHSQQPTERRLLAIPVRRTDQCQLAAR